MRSFSLEHLGDEALLNDLRTLVGQDRANTATLLAHIAEVDARRLYLPAAYPSMYEYCVRELCLSEDEAFARIRAARMAREHPAVYAAIAEGRLTLSAVLLLGPYLTRENADELLASAAHKTRSEIRQMLADRCPRLPVSTTVDPVPVVPVPVDLVEQDVPSTCQPEFALVSKRVDFTITRSTSRPLSPERFSLQCTIARETHEKLLYAQALLRHRLPSGDVPEVLDEALDALIVSLEKAKFAATSHPRACCGRSRAGSRYVPAAVKRAVWERDRGQCTFMGSNGKRCEARAFLEFDHVDPFARGGEATAEGMRLLCRAHNQYAAERTFGAGFMRQRRERAQREARDRRMRSAPGRQPDSDVVPWLRKLGFRAEEARQAAAECDPSSGAPIEERVRSALAMLYARRASPRVTIRDTLDSS